MHLYLDSADLTACRTWLPSGLFYGVTTNPLILRRDKVPCRVEEVCALARDLLDLGAQEVQLQPWGDEESRCAQIAAFADLGERVVMKLPMTRDGVRLAREAHGRGRRVTLTAVYAPHQAVVAAAAGVAYLAPYFGRMNEAGRDALRDVLRMQAITRGSGCEVLVASLRNISELTLLAERGLTHFTFSPATAEALFQDGLTERALADFERAAEAS